MSSHRAKEGIPCASGCPTRTVFRFPQVAWARGEPTPFLPGPAVDVLTLVPARKN